MGSQLHLGAIGSYLLGLKGKEEKEGKEKEKRECATQKEPCRLLNKMFDSHLIPYLIIWRFTGAGLSRSYRVQGNIY